MQMVRIPAGEVEVMGVKLPLRPAKKHPMQKAVHFVPHDVMPMDSARVSLSWMEGKDLPDLPSQSGP